MAKRMKGTTRITENGATLAVVAQKSCPTPGREIRGGAIGL